MIESGLFTDLLYTHLLAPQNFMHRLGILPDLLHTHCCLIIWVSVLTSVSPGVLSGVPQSLPASVSPGVLPCVSRIVLTGVPRSILASVSAGVPPGVSLVVLAYHSLLGPVIVSFDLFLIIVVMWRHCPFGCVLARATTFFRRREQHIIIFGGDCTFRCPRESQFYGWIDLYCSPVLCFRPVPLGKPVH